MKSQLILFAALLVLGFAQAEPRRNYHGAQVLRIVPETESHIHYLQGLVRKDVYDFWTEPRALGRPVDIMATAFQLPVLKKTLSGLGLEFTVQHSNVASLVEESLKSQRRAEVNSTRSMDWTTYHRYSEIETWLKSLAAEFPDLCQVVDIGETYESRRIKMLRLGSGPDTNPGIFIDGGIHAREWISPAVVTYMVNELVQNREAYEDILSTVNFYILPCINPDGYEYSFDVDRLWRKTRSDTGSLVGCMGVDGNRNWDYHWMETGASGNPCSDIYAGHAPFSEIEMNNVKKQIFQLRDVLKVYITYHSYSQLWLYPWGFTSDLPEDWEELDTLAQSATKALFDVHQIRYGVGSTTQVLYAAAGGSDDWVKGVAGVKYTYVVELRDTGHYAFDLPEDQIIPTGQENFAALEVIANFVKDTYGSY